MRADGRVITVPLGDLSQDRPGLRPSDHQAAQCRSAHREDRAAGRDPVRAGTRNCASWPISVSARAAGWRDQIERRGLFWTHNDSGDDARLYLFDSKGADRGSCLLAGIRAYDWEDMASFSAGGKNWLLVCDVGNNGRAAAVQMLHLIEEPAIGPDGRLAVERVESVKTIFVGYEDDFRDCEAVAVDPTDRTILFVTKEVAPPCHVYALAWPKVIDNQAQVARLIGLLKLPSATSLDVSPDGRRAVVLTYGDAFEYARGPKEDWAQAFSRPPRRIVLPHRAQGESIAYGPDGKTLYLTSERLPHAACGSAAGRGPAGGRSPRGLRRGQDVPR